MELSKAASDVLEERRRQQDAEGWTVEHDDCRRRRGGTWKADARAMEEAMTPRKYKVWWPDQDQTKDDARVFEGFDHEHAASEWAEWYDHHSAEYSIVGGTAAEVQVLREDEETARAVLVTGQLSRTYSGHALPANA